MDIREFIQIMKKDVDEFEKMWMQSHEDSPAMFPLELDSEGEWFDQFVIWLNQ